MSEALYDERIGPMLLEIGKVCEAHGLPFLAVVEYAPGEFGQSQFLPKDCGLTMTMANIAARCHGNLDAFMLSLLRYCQENGIDTRASMVANRMTGDTPLQHPSTRPSSVEESGMAAANRKGVACIRSVTTQCTYQNCSCAAGVAIPRGGEQK